MDLFTKTNETFYLFRIVTLPKLNEQILLKALKEAWNRRKNLFLETIEPVAKVAGQTKNVLAPELRLRDSSGFIWIIKELSNDCAKLSSADGTEEKVVDFIELEKSYELD